MAVMFSGVPDNYDSVFGPLVYTLTGIASGETVMRRSSRWGRRLPSA